MKSILFFLLFLCSNLLSAQEFKDYFTITLSPPQLSGYYIQLKEGIELKDSISTDGSMRVRKRDSLVLSSFQRELSALLRAEIIDKYHLEYLSFRMDITCDREGVVSDCGFSIEPEDLQFLPESLFVQIYTAFVAKVEPSLVSKIVNEFWKKAFPNEKRRTGYTRLLVSIKIDTERNQLGIRWFS